MNKASDLVRIVQVSDTHINRKRAYFFDNREVFVDEMRRQPPDLIVHSGDVAPVLSRESGDPDQCTPLVRANTR